MDSQSYTEPVEPPFETGPEPGYVQVALPDTPATLTRAIVAVIVVVFIVDMLTQGLPTALGAKVNDAILEHGQYYRLLTVMFLHSGLAHVFLNTYALWVIGPDVERFYGHLRFAVIFFLGGLTASVFSLALTPSPAVGASGAVFAIFAAEMVLLFRNRELFGDGARRRLQSLVLLLVLNAAIGFAGAGLIDNWAHIGGFLGGAALSWLLVPTYRVVYAADDDAPARLGETDPGGRVWQVAVLWLALLAAVVAWLTLRTA